MLPAGAKIAESGTSDIVDVHPPGKLPDASTSWCANWECTLKELLASSSDVVLTEPRIRSLIAIDRALILESTQVPDKELQAVVETIQNSNDWKDVFKGIAKIRLSADGTGVDVAIHLTKKDGIPVRIAGQGDDPQAVIAIRKVNDTDFYCYSTQVLANKIGLTLPKTGALIRNLGLQADAQCFKAITIGRSQFKMYSGNALVRLREALPNVDIDEVWRNHGPKRKKPK